MGKSFQGVILFGMGFTFDDANSEATPIAEMKRLVASRPKNKERIFPYIGGEEINDSPTHANNRYVINFGVMTKEEASRWPELLRLLEQKVKPDRATKSKDVVAWPWWQFWRPRPELHAAIAGLDRVIAIARVSQTAAFTFLPARMVYSEQLVVFAYSSNSAEN